MKTFETFGLTQELAHALTHIGYHKPTPIQEKAIPLALQGRDILGSAQTGTGKTAAFGVPLVEMILRAPEGKALVLTPTRELAKQVLDTLHQFFGPRSPVKTAFIIGGEPMAKQLSALKQHPRIIVGTPGRVNDHLSRRSLTLDDCGFLVLDETDRMLDMGFGVQLDRIAEHLPADRQTLMFSATLPQEIIRLSSQYLNNPERIAVGATNVVAKNIKQDVIRIAQEDKYDELCHQLDRRSGSVIVFVKTKHSAERIAKKLRQDDHEANALHGDLRQNKRTSVMKAFREQKFRILVATDIAARGLDVPHIEHVVNYDLPQVAEDYIHRMGRTARAGAQGAAVCFVAPQDGRKWHAIEHLLDPDAVPAKRGENKKFVKGKRKPNASSKPKPKSKAKPAFKAAPDKPKARVNDAPKSKPAPKGKPAQAENKTKSKGDVPLKRGGKPGAKPGGKPEWKSGGKAKGNNAKPDGGFRKGNANKAGNKPFKGKGKPPRKRTA